MEGRLPTALHLEMTDLSPVEYRERRAVDGRLTVFTNAHPGRTDLPRTLPECHTLAVVETTPETPLPPADPAVATSLRFVRTARPGQGSLSDEPTTGLELVLISPRDPARAGELRDWADFVHLRHIAEAAVPGFRMITPWVNEGEGPRFLHLYELHTDDPEGAFQAMTPAVARRLGGEDREAYRTWAWHPQLRIDYVNTFARVDPA